MEEGRTNKISEDTMILRKKMLNESFMMPDVWFCFIVNCERQVEGDRRGLIFI